MGLETLGTNFKQISKNNPKFIYDEQLISIIDLNGSENMVIWKLNIVY